MLLLHNVQNEIEKKIIYIYIYIDASFVAVFEKPSVITIINDGHDPRLL